MQRTLRALLCSIALLYVFAGLLIAQTSPPSISLSSPSTTAWETDQSSIDLQGTAMAQSGLSNVLWVNQLGKRGVGAWTATGDRTANWEVRGIALRPGTNLITVTAVDSGNRSASLHLAINRKVVAGMLPQQPLAAHSGTWKNRPIVYQLWNGMAVIEGDIILGPAGLVGSGSTAPLPASMPAIKPDFAISYNSQFWPSVNGIFQVPYVITGSSPNLTTALNNFNQDFSGLIQFVSRSSQANYVNIMVQAGGGGEGFSNVGMIGGEQTLHCGDGCTVATWIHEMGHTIGLLHEHQRPDRANYITLNLANADLPNVPGNFTLFTYNYQTIGLFDYASVMEYAAFDFSKAGLPIIESIPPGIPLSNNVGYSAGDIDQIKRLYRATPSEVTVTTNPPGLKVVVDSITYTAPQTFSWTLNSMHTIDVPADPQTTTPNDGSTYAFGVWNDLGARSHTITVQPGAGSLTAPANKPAVTAYEANFIRLQPFAFLSPSVFPSGAGTVSVSPSPKSEYGGNFFTDRTLVTLTLVPTQGSGYNFYDWFNLPYPPSDNPHAFYIQAPTTQAQAVFVSTPVTIVGESITGPNTWNSGLAGSVDGGFAVLPTAFSPTYNGVAWNAGTSHTVAVNQTQSPVTTNVFYNWNNWSDGGAISHSVTQPSSGSQTVSASFTPFYAFYTVPAPLGGPNSSCYGGAATSPIGTPYPANTVFNFYEDGTSVTATATANSNYPGMVFAGWTGSLSGNTNPQMTTIHDQFVPTANFNTISTPITITSLSPAAAPASSSALDVTINGTGFTSNTTFVYWNNSFRSSSYVSPTQLTLHLNAGDLANPGGQDVFVGNYITNTSKSTCGVGAEASFMVTTAQPQPSSVALTSSKNPSTFGDNVIFTATVTAASGTPTGTVTFKDGTTTLATVALSAGKAAFTASTLAGGTHSITAVYGGSVSYVASTSPVLSQVVNKQATSTAVVSSLNPSTFGKAVTFTATVKAASSGTPTGTVTFKDSMTTLATVALSSGKAAYTTSTLTGGTHSITAVYGGSVSYVGSTSPVLSQVVNKQATSTAVVSSLNPSTFGQSVTFTATVKAASSGTPTGTVTFKDSVTTLATVALSTGKAAFTTSTLAGGTHSITAVYGGSVSYVASTSPVLSQVVNKQATSTAVVSSLNPSTSGQSVTFTATVKAASSGTPTGTVTFKDSMTTLATVALSAGKATYTTSTLTGGTHSITAVYGGSVSHAGSTSLALTQTVH
jgi:hypothetical protein